MEIRDLKVVMELIREKITAEVPVSQIEIFLMVAENEGITEQEIMDQIDMPRPTVKRNIARLTDQAKGAVFMQGGYALCDVRDDGAVFLTENGKQLINDLLTGSKSEKQVKAPSKEAFSGLKTE